MSTVIQLDDALEEYLRHRKAAGIATNTIKSDRYFLTRFVSEVGNLYVRTVQARHVDIYMSAVAEQWGDGTLNGARTHLAGFFKFCRSRRWMARDEDPLVNMRRRKQFKKAHQWVPVTRFNELLDYNRHPRDRMVMSLGMYLFLRASEIQSLRIKDVHLDTGDITVTVHKSKMVDEMPISAPLRQELTQWLTYYTTEVGVLDPEFYLVPAKHRPTGDHAVGSHLFGAQTTPTKLKPTRQVIQPHTIVQRALDHMGLETHHEGIHTLRRSGARAYLDELYADGYDRALETVSTMLHHANMSTTQVYLGLDESRKRRNVLLKDKPMFTAMSASAGVTKIHSVGSP